MKKYLFLVLLFSSVILSASPRIIFENKKFDFGKILEGDSAVCLFHFRNMGDSILHIKDIRPTCGCTIVESVKRTYKPHEKGIIKATFHSSGRRGEIKKFIRVLTNDSERRIVRLEITGSVTKTWSLEPGKVDFREIKRDGIVEESVLISTELLDTISVDSVKAEPCELSARVVSQKGNKVKLKISYDSSSLKWKFIGIVRFYSNIPHGYKIIIPVYATIKQEKPEEN